MDWRTHGAVTKPKNQGSCGGCFAFAAVGAFEFWYWKHKRQLKDFSVQQWLDCSKPENYGCDGGVMNYVFDKARTTPAGPASFDPYLHRNSKCKVRRHKPWVRVKSYATQSDEWHYPIESRLAHNLVQYGPIPVGIDSSSWHLQLYESGILKASKCGKDIDHAVLVVGFTPKYWIIKNSWGTAWGEEGYFYLERGKNACGINSYASFITEADV
jgi:C1A family cysteine protease